MNRSGLYLKTRGDHRGFEAEACGALAGLAEFEGIRLFFEGILLSDAREGWNDAEIALARYRDGGVSALETLDGFFNLIVIDGERAYLVGDEMASRPIYVYQAKGCAAVASTPQYFAESGLAMSVDRDGIYQLFRLCHGVGGRTIVKEVTRKRARSTVRIHADGRVEQSPISVLEKLEDPSMSADDAATLIRESHTAVLEPLLSHPKLRKRRIDLPLTAGLDSRHILAELIHLGHSPDRLVHIWHQDAEYNPVVQLAKETGLRLDAPRLGEIDFAKLTRTWLEKSSGLVHFHQIYLFAVAGDDGPALGFDGYLADYFMGYTPGPLAKRFYNAWTMKLLFEDYEARERQALEELERERSLWRGPETWCQVAMYTYNRCPGYTGAVYPILGGDNLYFAPGAHRRSLEFFQRVPQRLLVDKRARLHMFRRDFPELAQFPTEAGVPLSRANELPAGGHNPDLAQALRFAQGILPWTQSDPMPQSEHEWLRRMPFFVQLLNRVIHEGEFIAHGHLSHWAKKVWRAHRAGGSFAWTLMAMVSLEAMYQSLVLGRSPDDVSEWLLA